MKRLWGLATGIVLIFCGSISTARAETLALNFEVATTRIEVDSRVTFGEQTELVTLPLVSAIELSFDLDLIQSPDGSSIPKSAESVESVESVLISQETATDYTLERLFTGGSHSLVAISVGNAEGTRTPTGGYTRFYNGHTDPGNRAWNLGTFSYQHGAHSPEEADAKQLKRLLGQAQELRRQAIEQQITLTLMEELNGIDLANQAPTTAIDRGYIKWLQRAKQTPMDEAERIIWARTRSFIHPDTGRWNAPGLGNTLESVTRDQRRRQQAIETSKQPQSPME